jgi:hypothetical protein
MTHKTFSSDDLEKRYQGVTACARAECTFVTEMVGGQPATPKGVEMFVRHHFLANGVKKPKEETVRAEVQRILEKEVGSKDIRPELGELSDALSYGVNIIRRDTGGPWLGDWMIKACLKAAASRIGLLVSKRGAKGDMAEMGRVRAIDFSARSEELSHVYLVDRTARLPAKTHFSTFMGSVSGAQGRKSIVHDSECVPPGTRFAFEYRFFDQRLTAEDAADIFACAMTIGLGSCKAMERGKFKIKKLTVEYSQ